MSLHTIIKIGTDFYTAVGLQMTVFWIEAPCSLPTFQRAMIALMMEVARTSEMLVNHTTLRYNPEDNN